MLYFFVISNIKNFYKYETEIEFLLIVKFKGWYSSSYIL